MLRREVPGWPPAGRRSIAASQWATETRQVFLSLLPGESEQGSRGSRPGSLVRAAPRSLGGAGLPVLRALRGRSPLRWRALCSQLDNRFISEGVVPKIRSEKRRRQFIFSTHNANIAVLGDAELIVAMRAVGEAGDGHADVPREHMGAIDKETVASLVEGILEGGKEAFQTRRLKYGF
jgi:hypothetical protein